MPKKIERPQDKYKLFLVLRLENTCEMRKISAEHQQAIARRSQTTYDKLRKDPGGFTIDQLLRFCKKFGIPLWDFLNPNVNINLEVEQ